MEIIILFYRMEWTRDIASNYRGKNTKKDIDQKLDQRCVKIDIFYLVIHTFMYK